MESSLPGAPAIMIARSKIAIASVAAASSCTESETLNTAYKMHASVYSLRQQRDSDGGKRLIS